jgi:hypothetical protein
VVYVFLKQIRMCYKFRVYKDFIFYLILEIGFIFIGIMSFVFISFFMEISEKL